MDITQFNQLPLNSRVWIYVADRPLQNSEVSTIDEESEKFISQWKVHGHDMQAKAGIIQNQFWILAANEDFHEASGCGIDKTVKFIQSLGEHFQIDFFNRLLIPFHRNENSIELITLSNLKSTPPSNDSLVYDTTINSLHGLMNHWPQVIGDTWLKKYMQPSMV